MVLDGTDMIDSSDQNTLDMLSGYMCLGELTTVYFTKDNWSFT